MRIAAWDDDEAAGEAQAQNPFQRHGGLIGRLAQSDEVDFLEAGEIYFLILDAHCIAIKGDGRSQDLRGINGIQRGVDQGEGGFSGIAGGDGVEVLDPLFSHVDGGHGKEIKIRIKIKRG